MKNLKHIPVSLSAAALLLALTACNSNDEEATLQQQGVPVVLTVGINSPTVSRAATDLQSTNFVGGQTFYAMFSGATAGAGNSTVYTISYDDATKATPAVQPVITGGSPTVSAYFPASVTENSESFSVLADQSTDENYCLSDLMFANAAIAANGNADLAFDHRMAKVVVNVNLGMGIENVTGVRLVGAYRTVNLSAYATPGTTLSDPVTHESPLTVFTGNSTTTVSCAALLPPQDISTANNFLEVVTDKGTAAYKLAGSGSVSLTGGNTYVLTANVMNVHIGLTTSIVPWTQNEERVYGELDI